MAILGLNIVTGYSGQISIGHSFFFGIGAYDDDPGRRPRLAVRRHPADRRRHRLPDRLRDRPPGAEDPGLYLSLVTLGLALAFPAIAKSDNFFGVNFASLTGGSNGKSITGGDVTTTEGFVGPAVVGARQLDEQRLDPTRWSSWPSCCSC